MLGFAILAGFNLLGMFIHDALHVPLPANVIGFMLFTLALFMKWIKLEWVEQSAQFLLQHLMLFFAPVIIGTMVFFPLIGQYWITIITSIVLSTFVVLLVTGWTVQLLSRKQATSHESD